MRSLLFGLIILSIGSFFLWQYRNNTDERFFHPQSVEVFFHVHGLFLGRVETGTATVGEFLLEQGLGLRTEDTVLPTREARIIPGIHIWFEPARSLTIQVDGKKQTIQTRAKTNEDVLLEQQIILDEDDLVEPGRETVAGGGATLQITRVEIREEYRDVPIEYTTEVAEDSELSWRVKKVIQKGEKGTKRTTYRVSYHDGKEVRRKILETKILREPVVEKVVQGTYVKLGKSHRGAASWYAWTGTMAAANPWLPKGSYVKVTNLDNGKSVIVVINDRGPFVPGRIIDLDKVAFAKIASVGAGVINVKMEEIVN